MEGKPRRPGSSRSVVWMTPEQIQRKRALDRVNQRSSRANARKRIEELEAEVQRLLSALQESERERLRLQSSEQGLRDIIQNAFSSMQQVALPNAIPNNIDSNNTPATSPMDGQSQPSPNVTSAPQISVKTALPGASSTQSAPSTRSAPSVRSAPSDAGENDAPGESSTTGEPMSAMEGTENAHMLIAEPNAGFVLGRPLFPKDDDSLRLWDSSSNNINTGDFWAGVPLTFPVDGLTFDNLMGAGTNSNATASEAGAAPNASSSESSTTPPPATPEALATLETNNSIDSLPSWAVLPQHFPPVYQIDHVIAAVTRNRRMHQNESGNRIEFSSPTYPSIASLLNPSTERASKFPVSSTLAKHAPWMSVPSLPEKLAVMYGICNLVRWYIEPTSKHYEAIPPFYRPTRMQIQYRHPAWVDVIAWPATRERIIQRMDFNRYDYLRSLLAETLSVNWPHSPSAVISMVSNDEIALTPQFITHILDFNNWSVGQKLVDAFPYLDCMPVREKPSS